MTHYYVKIIKKILHFCCNSNNNVTFLFLFFSLTVVVTLLNLLIYKSHNFFEKIFIKKMLKTFFWLHEHLSFNKSNIYAGHIKIANKI